MRCVAAAMAFAGVIAAVPARGEPSDWTIDPEHLSIGFAADHLGYARVLGQFLSGRGSFVFDEDTGSLSELEVEVEVGSVFTAHEERDGHLRSADFLAADEHPIARFVMTEATATGENTGKVAGDLTLRGVTRPIVLEVELNKIGSYPFGPNYVLGVSATTTVRRSDFGSTYAVANGWVADEIPITIELEAIRGG